MMGLWGMPSTPLLPSLPGPPRPKLVVPDNDLIYGLNRTKLRFSQLNCVLTIKLHAYAELLFFFFKLNCFYFETVLTLNGFFKYRTVFIFNYV